MSNDSENDALNLKEINSFLSTFYSAPLWTVSDHFVKNISRTNWSSLTEPCWWWYIFVQLGLVQNKSQRKGFRSQKQNKITKGVGEIITIKPLAKLYKNL